MFFPAPRQTSSQNSNGIQSFKFVPPPKAVGLQLISPTILSCTLAGGHRQSLDVHVTCQAQYLRQCDEGGLSRLSSELHVELDSPSQVPVRVTEPIALSATVGLVKLHIRYDNEVCVFVCRALATIRVVYIDFHFSRRLAATVDRECGE